MKYDIAHQLDLLYDYMYRRLVDANIKKDGAIVEEVLASQRNFGTHGNRQ